MSTLTPPAVVIADRIETPIGTLRFSDGLPDEGTVEKVYDNLDFQRGVQSVLTTMPAAAMHAVREGIRSFGPDNETVVIFENLLDSKSLFLTPNTESVYALAWIDLRNGPVVIESPPNTLGVVDDFWFRYVADVGNAGPDRGQGGKYLFLPPYYAGVPDGYLVLYARTFNLSFITRGFLVNGDPKPAVENIKQHLRIYPLSKADNPPVLTFANGSGRSFNTIHSSDFTFFAEVNDVVQEEPADAIDPETLGLLATIGIEKGKPFAPDERMKNILTEAAYVANATARAITYRTRMKEAYFSPDSAWKKVFVGGNHEFLRNGARMLDARYALPLLCDRHHAGDGGEDAGRRRLAVRAGVRRRAGSAARRWQELPLAPSAEHPGEGLLVGGALRQPDAIGASDRSAVPEHQQSESGRGRQPGSIGGHLFRPQGAARCGAQLDPDVLGEGMECDPAAVRSASAVVRPNLAAR